MDADEERVKDFLESKEKRRIDLFIWLDDHKPYRLLFSQTNESHHAKLLAVFGASQDDITQIDS